MIAFPIPSRTTVTIPPKRQRGFFNPLESAVVEAEVLERHCATPKNIRLVQRPRMDMREANVLYSLYHCSRVLCRINDERMSIYPVHYDVGERDVLDERGFASKIVQRGIAHLDGNPLRTIPHHKVGKHTVANHTVVHPSKPYSRTPTLYRTVIYNNSLT